MERLETDINKHSEEIRFLKEANQQQALKLNDAGAMLKDKENLEVAVRKQHDLIEKQGEELKVLKKQLEDKDAGLEKAKCVDG